MAGGIATTATATDGGTTTASVRAGVPAVRAREREDERGFFERAGDEVRSWFSEDDMIWPGPRLRAHG